MTPLIANKTRNTPQNTKWFNGTRGLHFAHVFHLKPEFFDDNGSLILSLLFIAADEHRGLDPSKIWIDHVGVADRVKGLHKVDFGKGGLQFFHQGFLRCKKIDNTILRRGV